MVLYAQANVTLPTQLRGTRNTVGNSDDSNGYVPRAPRKGGHHGSGRSNARGRGHRRPTGPMDTEMVDAIDADAARFWQHDKYSDDPTTRASPPRFNELNEPRRSTRERGGFRVRIEGLHDSVGLQNLKVSLPRSRIFV